MYGIARARDPFCFNRRGDFTSVPLAVKVVTNALHGSLIGIVRKYIHQITAAAAARNIPPERARTKWHLTVELSGAHAVVWAWHFIYHASAPAIC